MDCTQLCSENKGADQLRGSAPLFWHMQNSGFVTMKLKLRFVSIPLTATSLFCRLFCKRTLSTAERISSFVGIP